MKLLPANRRLNSVGRIICLRIGVTMHLIMRTQFDELRLNDEYEYSTNDRGGKKVVKIYKDGELIAKKISIKNSVQYFGVTGVEELLEQV
ncbi:Conserved hypothetical protein [Shewanella piezotolerans WP3]|uniref:Uncharacterized protein n=2 Tax=Shewanella TaxID=22 RepID=B8CUM0_SHEPW|nr:Conserved hypothetical protein [Shewanella piezotolerans WP3]